MFDRPVRSCRGTTPRPVVTDDLVTVPLSHTLGRDRCLALLKNFLPVDFLQGWEPFG
jgi:hypothetical protein